MPHFDTTMLYKDIPGIKLLSEACLVGDAVSRSVGNGLYRVYDGATLRARNFMRSLLPTEHAVSHRMHRQPLRIPGSALFFWNPEANKKKATNLAAELRSAIDAMVRAGTLSFDGACSFHATREDADERIEHIVGEAKKLLDTDPHQRIAIVAFGGDRTADDIAFAVAEIRKRYARDGYVPNVAAVAYPGGTANDVRAVTGAPSARHARDGRIKDFIRFLSNGDSAVANIPLIKFMLKQSNGRRLQWHTIYAFTAPNSGVFFGELEKIKRERKITGESVTVVGDYLPKLPGCIWEARKATYVNIVHNGRPLNDGRPFKTGELFLTVIGQFGGVTKMPIPEGGARVYVPYQFPEGIIAFSEAVGRKLLVEMGFQCLVNAGGRMYPLSRDRQIDMRFGDRVDVAFIHRDGSARDVLGTLAGDVVGPLRGFEASVVDAVPFLCGTRSDLMVLQGQAAPTSPLQNNSKSVASPVRAAGRLAVSGMTMLKGVLR